VHCVNLTDDELLQEIAVNTDAVSDLLCRRAELEAEIRRTTDPASLTAMMSSYMVVVHKFESDYRSCMAELRRRYPA